MSKNISVDNGDDNSALMELLAPDGYYSYLGVTKPVAAVGDAKNKPIIDEDVIKKNYRKLSLKHHPDKPGGDADVFRVLNRAQRVLVNAKLRQQYDILGIDLDDDEDDHHHESTAEGETKETSNASSTQGIVQEIAATVLAGIIQLGVRTRKLCADDRKGMWARISITTMYNTAMHSLIFPLLSQS
jgi:DnaJ-class molecular chaperone